MKQSIKDKYEYFLSLTRSDEPRPLERIALDPKGKLALECFHIFESTGKLVPTSEPLLLERFIIGKGIHGMTVTMVAEDLISGVAQVSELQTRPPWVAKEIVRATHKLAINKLGFVPTFLKEYEV